MDGKIELSLDNLPIKRLDIIEENGLERFPQELDYEEKTLSLVRRIDFAWALERDEEENKKKKQKKSSETSPWPWQSMVENLQLAHQELSVVIDLINTVEANDAVTVAGMTRPKPLPNEVLSDLSVCTATKLQCFWHLGKYFKQSAKGLEQQIAREARFYGALIRLQQNWKVKRQRVAASVPSNEGFTFDLFDNTLYDSASVIRRSSQSTVRIDHDLAGMLTINLPPNLNHALQFGFHGMQSRNGANDTSKMSFRIPKRAEIDSANDEDCINRSHSLLREVHQAIFNEQVFNLVNREAFNPSIGYNVTGRSENSLQLSLGEGLSVYISLVPPREYDETEEAEETQNTEGSLMSLESFTAQVVDDKTPDIVNKHGFPNCISYEIYLQQIFHEHVFMKERGKSKSARSHVSRRPTKEGPGLLGHFSLSLAHRIFANKVLLELENVVYRVAYLHLISHPTWQSRTSSWTIFMQFPQSILHVGCQDQTSDSHCIKSIKSQFRLKVVVVDDCISIEGEDTPNVVNHFKGSSENISATNRYECDMVDLPVIILQQIASQIIRWLHEEALTVGVKAIRDFLSLSFELDQGETLSLVVHVDPKDPQGCISWSLVMEDDYTGMQKLHTNGPDGVLPCRKFLGYLSLDALYSALMELISVCNGGGSHLSA